MNIDATVFSQSKSVGIGVVIYDHEDSVIATMSKHLPLPLGPLEAESKVMDEVVFFAWDIVVCDVIFEGDSCIMSHALSRSASPPISIANIISDTHHKMQEFKSLQMGHMKRLGNKLAHTLTKYAKKTDSFVIWIKENPSIIESLVIQDVMYLSSS